MDIITDLRIATTVLSLLVFLAICFWAYSKSSKGRFEEAANVPFLDDDLPVNNKNRGEQMP